METAPLSDADEALVDAVMATNEQAFDPEFFDGGHSRSGRPSPTGTATTRSRRRPWRGAGWGAVALPAVVRAAALCLPAVVSWCDRASIRYNVYDR